ncbi:polymerase delta-interacting protein 3-like [Stegodyphus dumicola]|uniref:polymerase delta-interacting protein 3-like n=1 Tax=Stegodyphus dumicola TaxID=202533 RepID=UPI0015AA7AA3|nr:polymerase delta-interacting protein 3-like [Stegodyphus dumicola]
MTAQDGHTSRPKTDASAFGVAHPSPKLGIIVSSRSKQLQTSSESWESNVDDLEHIGIDDLMDMDSLPSALLPAKTKSESKTAFPKKSLAEQVLTMNNTMVADQELAAAMQQSVTVYVTNLRSSVSKQDIVELFGDIGRIKSAELCYPGTAVIEFFSQEDAEKACEIYHNRLLDGQPMKCCIQPILRPSRTSVSQRLGERIADFGISHPVTSSQASSSRSRYNPRNVQFTVKLA